MKIRDFQMAVAERLNRVESLAQADCKALAEDSKDIVSALSEQLAIANGVAIVVTTPNGNRNGCCRDFIPCESQLVIKCIEKPATNREMPSHITALEAVQYVANELDGAEFNFTGWREYSQGDVLIAEATFNCEIDL